MSKINKEEYDNPFEERSESDLDSDEEIVSTTSNISPAIYTPPLEEEIQESEELSIITNFVEDEEQESDEWANTSNFVEGEIQESEELSSASNFVQQEVIVFEEWGILYKYDITIVPPLWQEHGRGFIKLLLCLSNMKVRIVMRRDIVLNVCASHYITQSMNVKPLVGSQTTLVWNTEEDLTDEVPQKMVFAIEFPDTAEAKKFYSAFRASKFFSTPEGTNVLLQMVASGIQSINDKSTNTEESSEEESDDEINETNTFENESDAEETDSDTE